MELRLYSFVNFYLSSIQQGIQTGHVAVDLVRKYTANGNPLRTDITEERVALVENWADNWKTFITLNGGNAEGIAEATLTISKSGFPWAIFKEDESSLGGIQTCVAVILPDFIFGAQRKLSADRATEYFEFEDEDGALHMFMEGHPHFELIKLVKSCRLAQ
jgi:hypothetical protein